MIEIKMIETITFVKSIDDREETEKNKECPVN